MRALGIILAFAVALWSGRLQAQHYIGVRGGWGGGSVRFQPVRETGIHWGLYSGGLSYKFYTEQKYVGAIQVDLEYMQRGFMYDEVRGGDTSYHRTINTFELPFMWQPHIYVFQRHARVYLNLGVYLSYATGSKYYWQSKKNGIFEQGDYPMMLTRDPRWGYGLCGGGGFSVLFGRFEAAFEARYYLGYSDVLRNGTKYTGNPNHSPLDNINLSLAVYYRLGKGGIRSAPSKGVAGVCRRPPSGGLEKGSSEKRTRRRRIRFQRQFPSRPTALLSRPFLRSERPIPEQKNHDKNRSEMSNETESTRQQKVARQIQRDIGDIFSKEAASLLCGAMVSVTLVRMSPDLELAKVYLSVFPFEKHTAVMESLEKNNWLVRKALGTRVKHQLRHVPELVFRVDDSLEYISTIDKLLKE